MVAGSAACMQCSAAAVHGTASFLSCAFNRHAKVSPSIFQGAEACLEIFFLPLKRYGAGGMGR